MRSIEMPPFMGKPGGGKSKLLLLFGGGGGSFFAKAEKLNNIITIQHKYVKFFLLIVLSVICQ